MKKMSKVKVVIELNYDTDVYESVTGDEMGIDEFVEYLEELVPEDLEDLIRTERLKHWSEISVDGMPYIAENEKK